MRNRIAAYSAKNSLKKSQVDTLKAKMDYLINLYDEENDRQKILEGKCFQLISNSGIFISIIGLLITLLFGQKDSLLFPFNIGIPSLIIGIILGFGYCMNFALKVLNPTKYPYQRGDPKTIDEHTKEENFYNQLLIDYKSCIDANMLLNNTKADDLKSARSGFVFAIYATMILTIGLVIYGGWYYKVNAPKIQPVDIINLKMDTEVNKIKSGLDSINKTLKVRPKGHFKKGKPIVICQHNNQTFYLSNP